MEKNTFSVRIPEPCHEDWTQMGPQDKGRFCNSCSKVVVDFTKMDLEEVKAYFIEHSGQKTCGRFRNEQLEPPRPLPQLSYLARLRHAAAVLVSGLSIIFISSCNRIGEYFGTTKGEIMVKETDTTKIEACDPHLTTGDTVTNFEIMGQSISIQPRPQEFVTPPEEFKIDAEQFHTKGNVMAPEESIKLFPPPVMGKPAFKPIIDETGDTIR